LGPLAGRDMDLPVALADLAAHSAATWSLVATVSEPARLVIAFAAHALAKGAARVDLYMDASAPPLARTLSGHPQIKVTLCDPANWRGVPGGRPWPTALRQRINLQSVLDAPPAQWVLHSDADEYLWGPGDPGLPLAALPDKIDQAILPTIERVHIGAPDPDDILAGRFWRVGHGADQQDAIDLIDGDAARFLRHGMAGYAGGKCFFRAGRALRAGIHTPDGADPVRMQELAGWKLLHFDGLTPASWISKKQHQIAQQPEWRSFPDGHVATRNQLTAVHAAGGDRRQQAAVCRAIKTLDPVRAEKLDSMGLLSDARIDLRAAIAAALAGLTVDLSSAAFDAEGLMIRLRRDLQWVNHGVRGVVSRLTGQPPGP